MLRISYTISSFSPGRAENWCFAPSILILVMADPEREVYSTRRKELPRVCPKPISRGSRIKCPNVGDSSWATNLKRGTTMAIYCSRWLEINQLSGGGAMVEEVFLLWAYLTGWRRG